jgi:hypothetical protein
LSPDIFIHTWSNQGSVSRKEEPYTDDPHDNTIKKSEIKDLYDAEKVVVEDFQGSYYKSINNVSVPDNIENHSSFTKSILPLFYKMSKCNKLKNLKQNREEFIYDIVIVTRPDIAILSPLPQNVLNNPQYIWELRDDRGSHVLDDLLVVSSSKNIDYYTSIFNQLNKYWKNTTRNEYQKQVPYFTRAQRLLRYHIDQSDIKTRRSSNYEYMSDWLLVRYGMDVSFYQKDNLHRILHILSYGDTGIPTTSNIIQEGVLSLRRDGICRFMIEVLNYILE